MNESYELKGLSREVAELKAAVHAQSEAVKDLVDAWNTARGMVRFIKWMGGIATALSAIGVAVKFIWSK